MPLVAVAAPPWVERPADLESAGALADLIELRLDLLSGATPRAWVAASPRPVLATVRGADEGGAFRGEPAEAAALLIEAAEAGAAWVDAETGVVALVASAARRAGARVLASAHGAGPLWLPRTEVDAWKVARPVRDGAEALAALDLARRLAEAAARGAIPPATVVPYGPLGGGLRVVTAAIAEAAGIDPFVFGAPADTGGSPPGALVDLPVLEHLLDELRLGEIGPRARLFGLVGRPPARSPSPALHNAVFRALGLDAVYLPAADLSAVEALALPWSGWSVTVPRKEEVAARCDVLDPVAARCGAVNTVVRAPDRRLHGANTDALAVLSAARDRGVAAGGALVVGSGGFARAAAAALVEAGLAVRVVGRDAARRARAAADLGVEDAGGVAEPRPGDVVLVNATPVGGDGTLPSAFEDLLARLPAGVLVIDAPYARGARPGAVARAAAARGLAVEDGPSLLLRQAAGQSRAFTGHAPPGDVLACALRPSTNVVLFGPRGAGKTTVGRLVARRLGRPFVDTDAEIAGREGRPAGEVLALRGEAAFRRIEEDVVGRALARRGVVVAVGGGAPTRDANARRIAARSFAVRLAVRPEEAARRIAADPTIRPRLTGAPDVLEECERVARDREGAYAALARATVETDRRDPTEVAEEVAVLSAAVFARGPGDGVGQRYEEGREGRR